MTTFEEVKGLVDENIELIAYSKEAFKDAIQRSTKFLMVIAVLAEHRMELERKKAKATTLRELEYSRSITVAEGKNVTEKKVSAEANPQYSEQREVVEDIEAEISWVKTNIEVFMAASVTYRQMAKEQ